MNEKENVKTPLTDEEIENLIEKEYSDKSDYTKDFIRKSIKRFGDEFYFYKTNRVDNNLTKVIITCKIHGDFEIDPQYFLKSKYCYGCPKCHPGYTTKMDLESFQEKLHKIHPQYDITENSVYTRNNVDIELYCTKHNTIFHSRPYNLLMGKCGCPECKEISKGEVIIEKWLEQNNISYISQFKIPVPALRQATYNKKPSQSSRVDFYLELNNRKIIIEYNGLQHYRYTPIFHKTVEDFLRQVSRDFRINYYCRKNDIELFTIPYSIIRDNIISFIVNIINNNTIYINLPLYEFPEGYSLEDVYKLIEKEGGEMYE